ncbi:MAG: amidohydrolase family protein [Anaerolineae bacterium]
MIIDAHTHLFNNYLTQQGLPVVAFVEGLAQAGIDKAIIMTVEGFTSPVAPANDALAAAARDYPGTLYAACTVHPRQGEAAIGEMERCARELGMVALKLHPWLQAFSVTDPEVVSLFKAAAALGWPVILHDGTPPYSTPLQIAYVARQVPEATVILGHGGLSDFPSEALAAARRCPNIVICPCGVPLNWMREFVRVLGAERLVFGSDYPFGGEASVYYYLDKMRQLGLSAEESEMVFAGNLCRLIPALQKQV